MRIKSSEKKLINMKKQIKIRISQNEFPLPPPCTGDGPSKENVIIICHIIKLLDLISCVFRRQARKFS